MIPSRGLDPSHATWDYGLEVSPGAHLAKDEINNRSDILPSYSLEVIDVGSEACGHSVIVDGLVNLYSHLVNRGSFIVGVTGMLRSSVTNVLVPVLSHPKINYLTIAASTSPAHRNLKQYPLLFHILSSSQIYVAPLSDHTSVHLCRDLSPKIYLLNVIMRILRILTNFGPWCPTP